MILTPYRVAPSTIPGAGKGLFIDAPVAAGRIIVAPDAINRVYRWDEVLAQPDIDTALASSVRWFEDRYTITPEWPDECYINHAFASTGLWHLGFVFAARDLDAGEEVTVDYRHLLREGEYEGFADALTGKPIIGYSWQQSLATSTAQLAELLQVASHAPTAEPHTSTS
ncbi:MAG: hypothetical protein CVV12_12395 [Gammaproteobacteria bacterium HGW-Gammaproteobacteria-2]|jgi:hypothetical protein|nr:MAG: hypothetical protein CVV12_12395 [Gammaproteobacteria bacterium HGW-Gammaproteobacteria-2]